MGTQRLARRSTGRLHGLGQALTKGGEGVQVEIRRHRLVQPAVGHEPEELVRDGKISEVSGAGRGPGQDQAEEGVQVLRRPRRGVAGRTLAEPGEELAAGFALSAHEKISSRTNGTT